ncbi:MULTISPECIES: RHS repeat-associated core domain-containing protein [unclassified Pseudomonas]|uniref:RHS repeat-associated core domain-containing protein n=1 Tax=unclassified Pseudomonas TaxID=196821 RepID=UPI00200D5F29|nr:MULTISPECIES: RHS repeat-associated core domain-containing protein [unclassified Pseudomonas]
MNANVHWHTPLLQVNDPRGLGIRQVEYLRKAADETAQALITRQQHDVAGRPVAQRDPRLTIPNATTVFALNGQALNMVGVDAGVTVTLPGLAGESRQTWDANGNHRRMTYDTQLRPETVEVNGTPDIERFTYADHSADPGHNLRGQLVKLNEPSGTLDFHSIGLTGNGLRETRTFHDGKAFVSRHMLGPTGTVLETTDACGHTRQSSYDVAGQLLHTRFKLNGQPDWQIVLNSARYDAAAHIIEQQAGNGVISRWHYRAGDGRLHRHYAQKASGETFQDFEHEYDPMGNITRILDHAYRATYFHNQRVDGHREFGYDTLYRLIRATGYADAPPSDNLARPQPTDPNDRRNYIERYEYDPGNNLVKTTHEREGANHIVETFIDPASNRGVRWKPGDQVPDFSRLFDPAGNLRFLQPGLPAQWNNRGELEKVTLVDRNGSGANDEEYYRYSQGERVYKRLDTHTTTVSHFHEVRYLPGLEIRTQDNGEELHVITLDFGAGDARCLHWEKDPANIGADQLRFTLTDHLGSAVQELDAKAQLISQEGYLPFGATAWMAARTLIEVEYRFIRYSGKEMDVTRLYYYGARYYADWLGRWISADPAGDVDGLNLYVFVGNNPLRYMDAAGSNKSEAQIRLASDFISIVGGFAEHTNQVMHDVTHQKHLKRNLFANLAAETVKGVIGYEAGVQAAGFVDSILPSVPGVPYLTSGGVIGGNIAGDVTGAMADQVFNPLADIAGVRPGPLIPQTSTMSVESINGSLGIDAPGKKINNWEDVVTQRLSPALDSVLNPEFVMGRLMASWISIIPGAISMFARAMEVEDIKNGLDPAKIGKIENMYQEWQKAVGEHAAAYEEAFGQLGVDVIPGTGPLQPSISLAGLREQTLATRTEIAHGLAGINAYKEMNTTDNRFLRAQAHPATKSHSRLYKWWTREG